MDVDAYSKEIYPCVNNIYIIYIYLYKYIVKYITCSTNLITKYEYGGFLLSHGRTPKSSKSLDHYFSIERNPW